MANGGSIDGGRELVEITNRDGRMGSLFQRIIDGVNRLAINTSSSPVGEIAAPKSPDSVNASVIGEYLHISINHSGQLQRGVRYFTEVSTNPHFGQASQVMILDHGTSRTPPPFPLPTKDANGHTINYYVRSYAQYPASQPSEPTVYGGKNSPTAITMSGTTSGTLLTCSGSGTGPNNGSSLGQGLGKTVYRS